MRSSDAAFWVTMGLFAASAALGAFVFLVLPEETRSWSALGMLAWIFLAGSLTAHFLARAGGGRFYRLFLGIMAAHGWIAMCFCASAWGLMVMPVAGNLFTMLFPITLLPALWMLWRGGSRPPALQTRSTLLMIALIAVGHLLYFYSYISPATRLYLIFLGVVSFLAARRVRRAAPSQAGSGGACQGSA